MQNAADRLHESLKFRLEYAINGKLLHEVKQKVTSQFSG